METPPSNTTQLPDVLQDVGRTADGAESVTNTSDKRTVDDVEKHVTQAGQESNDNNADAGSADGDVSMDDPAGADPGVDIPTQQDDPKQVSESPPVELKAAMINIQYKGQPVWQVTANDVPIIMRMTDLKLHCSMVMDYVRTLSSTHLPANAAHDIGKMIKEKAVVDESGDHWVSKDALIDVATEYNIKDSLVEMLNKFSLDNEEHSIHATNELHDIIIDKNTIDADDESTVLLNDVSPSNNNARSASLVSPSLSSSKKRQNDTGLHPLESPTKKNRQVDITGELKRYLPINENISGIPIFYHDLKDGVFKGGQFTLKPLTEDNILNENSKVIMSSLFLPYEENITLEKILKEEIPLLNDSVKKERSHGHGKEDQQENEIKEEVFDKKQIIVDVAIDDNGQAALHLAATLGKISLVKELIERGANRFRGDNEGQSALIRVVHATNCYELLCFDKLLDLLYPSLTLLDNRGRTILHHIALSCGLKGRYDASKYYLETLLEWVVKKGSKFPSDSTLTLSNFIKNVVNRADKYGNTCLIYATLAGNKYVISQLLDIGADPYKANKIGVTPADYGIDVNVSPTQNNAILQKGTMKSELNDTDKQNGDERMRKDILKQNTLNLENEGDDAHAQTGWMRDGNIMKLNNAANEEQSQSGSPSKGESAEFKETTNSLQILDSIQSFITKIGSEFKEELVDKSRQIEKLNPILKRKTVELSQKRKQFDELQKLVRKVSKITNKIDNLNKAITVEESKFQDEVKDLNIQIDEENILGDFDADQPFTILPLYNDIERITESLLDEKLKELRQEGDKAKDVDADGDKEKVSGYNVINALNSISVSEILDKFTKEVGDADLDALKKEIPPAVVLDARIRAYKKNNEMLMERMKAKRDSNKELEAQFKRIIGLCIGTDTENIDDKLLSNLLMSVENDPDPEIGQIKKVLKIVGDLDTSSSSGTTAPGTATTAATASTSAETAKPAA